MKKIVFFSNFVGISLLFFLQIGCGVDGKSPGRFVNPAAEAGFLSPSSARLMAGGTVQFSAPFDQSRWKVNGVVGGNATLGFISQDGLYSAPPVAPKVSLTITAVNIARPDSANRRAWATATADVKNPKPQIQQVGPNTVIWGTTVPVSITGSGFTPASCVQFSGKALQTKYLDSDHLSVVLPINSGPGTFTLAVHNSRPGGGTSAPQALTIANPQPVLNQIDPPATIVGANDFTVTLTGSGFTPTSAVQASGKVLSASYIDSGHLSAVVPANLANVAGNVPLIVVNDSPGGGASTAQQFIVANPTPVISSISPNIAVAGTEVTVQIKGNGFVSGSHVLLGGNPAATTFIGSNALTATIPATGLGSASEIDVAVANASPGGGSSQSLPLQVLSPGRLQNTNHPQVTKYSIQAPSGSSVEVEFGEDLTYGRNTWKQSASDASGIVNILVAGMKSFSTYHMRGKIHLLSGDTIYDQDHTFSTGGLHAENLPGLSPTTNIAQERSPGVELLDLLSPDGRRVQAVVSDLDGNVLWYYSPASTEPYSYAFPIKLLSNGNFFVNIANGTGPELREVTLSGETVQELSLESLNAALLQQGFSLHVDYFHHDFLPLDNGHFIFLAGLCKQFQDLPGYAGTTAVCGDALIDLDPQFKPVWTWSSFDHLDVNRHPIYFPDWTHSNAVIYSKNDGNLLVSMRHQGWVIKINYQNGQGNGDILWRLGPGGDFNLSGTADQWFYAQHYPNILEQDGPITKLAIFDNGNFRSTADQSSNCDENDFLRTGPRPCYTRAAIFEINEQLKTASLLWDYKPGFYSFWGGSIQQFSNGNIEFDMSQPFSNGSRIMEVEGTANPNVVWTMDIQPEHAYRAFRIPSLYPGVVWDH